MVENQDVVTVRTREPADAGLRPSLSFISEFKRRGLNYTKATPPPDKVLLVDFFAGAGGLSSAFHSTRQSSLKFEHLAAIDIDGRALATLAANVTVPTFQRDITELAANPTQLEELLPAIAPSATRDPLVFTGCPPCQGFSAHRKKDSRDDPRNSLIGAFVDLVLHYRPDVIVMENVPEMLNGRFQRYYEVNAARLRDAGYALSEAIVDMSKYGVPQRRRRAVVMGALTGAPELPAQVVADGNERTVRDAIQHLPQIEAGETDLRDPWHRAPKHIERILSRIRLIPPDGGDRRDLPASDQLVCHTTMEASSTTGFTDVYGRLRWDKPSVTITAKSSTPSCGRFLHPEQHRNISVREAALLQSFPHNYVFTGSFVNQYRQIGEAVPPLFARHLAYAVLSHFRPLPAKVVEVRERIAQTKVHKNFTPSNLLGVDLFCGAGGLSLGMEAAGFSTAYAADIDSDAIETFQKNIGPQAFVRDAVSDSIVGEIADTVDNRPYVVVGGPPCQGFSQQRRGSNIDPRNDLVNRLAVIATTLPQRPAAVVLENVMYLDSPRGKMILAHYIRHLQGHDYVVKRFNINSADFGLAQTRKRIVVMAVDRKFRGDFGGPQPVNEHRWMTIGEALLGLDSKQGLENHIIAKESAVNVKRMSFVDMGRGRTAIPEDLQMACHKGYDGHLDVYGRLDWFEYARTITGGFDSSSRGEYTHPFKNRSITAREAARLQGFPDSFDFLGNKAAVRRQIGNAVPPALGYAIGCALRAVLGIENG